jgi:hypothetical protein
MTIKKINKIIAEADIWIIRETMKAGLHKKERIKAFLPYKSTKRVPKDKTRPASILSRMGKDKR